MGIRHADSIEERGDGAGMQGTGVRVQGIGNREGQEQIPCGNDKQSRTDKGGAGGVLEGVAPHLFTPASKLDGDRDRW